MVVLEQRMDVGLSLGALMVLRRILLPQLRISASSTVSEAARRWPLAEASWSEVCLDQAEHILRLSCGLVMQG